MFVGKILMEPFPNIHPVGMLTMVYTLVYRKKALWPIYLYVFLLGVYYGFTNWWIPHLYVWLFLWGATMVLPRTLPTKVAPVVYMMVCALHGLLYGILWAPLQAIMFHYTFKGMIAWIVAGFPWDILHAIGNFAMGALVLPLTSLLKKLQKR